jgi:transaldolase
VMYVENLVGPDTVNTMPKSTVEDVKDHADIRESIEEDVDEANQLLKDLAEAGISYKDVTDVLEKEGVQKFADSFDELIEEIAQQTNKLARQD